MDQQKVLRLIELLASKERLKLELKNFHNVQVEIEQLCKELKVEEKDLSKMVNRGFNFVLKSFQPGH